MKKIVRWIIFGGMGIITFPTVYFLAWLIDKDNVPSWQDYKTGFKL